MGERYEGDVGLGIGEGKTSGNSLIYSHLKLSRYGIVNQAGGTSSDEMVIYPGGPRFKSIVHLIELGYHVAAIDGASHKVQTESGRAIKFLGKMNTV